MHARLLSPRRPSPHGTLGHRAFTLVELLVVISIIALLISLLLPALKQARATAMTLKCKATMQQLGLGVMMYADDHEGMLPPHNWAGKKWHARLAPYVGRVAPKRSVYCPSVMDLIGTGSHAGKTGDDIPAWFTGYAFNGNYALTTSPMRLTPLHQFPVPSKFVFVWEDMQCWGGKGNEDGGYPAPYWPNFEGGSWYRLDMDRHFGACNILLLDGHVANLSRDDKAPVNNAYMTARDFQEYLWDRLRFP
jgi:prepilin-type N-terminal cleavage/methylation domain-containing protein/prepilin-type processing-associated H-X9-DG protein